MSMNLISIPYLTHEWDWGNTEANQLATYMPENITITRGIIITPKKQTVKAWMQKDDGVTQVTRNEKGWDNPEIKDDLIILYYFILYPPVSLNEVYQFSFLRSTYWQYYTIMLSDHSPKRLSQELETEERLKVVCEAYHTDIETLDALLRSFWLYTGSLS